MRKNYVLISLFWLACCNVLTAQTYSIQPIPFNQVQIDDSFWTPRLDNHAKRTLPVCIAQIRDSTHRIRNFENAAGIKEGKHEGIYFDDSDVYKVMEGIAYSLTNNYNHEYDALLDQWIELISKAQQPDGYVNTYYTLNHPDERWTDIVFHEMYCGGHMIEAAIAYYHATGKRSFLDVAIKFADHINSTFGPGKRHWVPGHQEIELALVKLAKVTNERKYLELSHWLLEERGRGYGDELTNWDRWDHWNPPYCQNDVPVSELREIKGHAVRAMYLFTGMADVASEMNIPEYIEAMKHVWEDVVYRNMYITGGIGSSKFNEGFTEDFDLPNKTAYCETCASVGMVIWNNRMNLLTKEAKYVDVLERALYNGLLSGISLEGDLFFYVNPLESEGDHHREPWYGTACCPGNVCRIIPSIGDYIYLKNDNELIVNLFISNKTSVIIDDTKTNIDLETAYPWEGIIHLSVNPLREVEFDLKLRIPGWCKSYHILLNGKEIGVQKEPDGYLSIRRKWNPGDQVELALDMPVEMIEADQRVKENNGKRAIQRGPVVYCMEEVDNENFQMDEVKLDRDLSFSMFSGNEKLKEMKILKAEGENGILTFIPYFAWDNREPGKMKVWIDYEEHRSLYK